MATTKYADVVFALTGDIRRNSRALRQVHALSRHGWHVAVLSIGHENGQSLRIPNTDLHFLKPPEGSGPGYFWRVHRLIGEAASRISARVYHASDLYVLPALSRAAQKHHASLAYDARELYPHVAATVGRPWSRFFWMVLERRYIRRAKAVFSVSESIAEKLAEMYAIKRPTVVYNVPEANRTGLSHVLRDMLGLRYDETIFLHQGQIRRHRGCELLVDAMRDVYGAVLVFLGDGPLRAQLESAVADFGIEKRVRFLDPVSPDELLSYTAGADVGLSLLENMCLNHRFALPNKLFEYLVSGVPVIASNVVEVRRIVQDYDVGLVVDPCNRDDLVAALRQASIDKPLREKWRRNVPRVLETFNSASASQAFIRQYESVLLPTT